MARLLIVGGTSTIDGGVERFCERLTALLSADNDVARFYTGTGGRRSLGIVRLLKYSATLLKLGLALRRRSSRSGVVWIQYGNALDLPLIALSAAVSRDRLLVTIHCGKQWYHLRSPLGRRLAVQVLSRVDQCFTLTEREQSWWLQHGLKTEVIPTLLPHWINEERNLSGGAGAIRTVLYVGRIVREKGVFDLVRAVRLCQEDGHSLNVRIIGAGGDQALLQREIDLNGLSSVMHLCGARDERGVAKELMEADVFAYPSYVDTYPLSVLEACAMGTNVIAYGLEGTQEIVSKYGGAIVRPGDVEGLAKALCSPSADVGRTFPALVRNDLGWAKIRDVYQDRLG